MPELDEKFARLLGVEDGNLDRLREEVRENLDREIRRRLMLRNKDSAMSALLRVTEMELPKSLVEAEAKSLMQQTMNDMKA